MTSSENFSSISQHDTSDAVFVWNAIGIQTVASLCRLSSQSNRTAAANFQLPIAFLLHHRAWGYTPMYPVGHVQFQVHC